MSSINIIETLRHVDQALTPGPIQRLADWHFGRVKNWAKTASEVDLKTAIKRRGTENLVNTVVISTLMVPGLMGLEFKTFNNFPESFPALAQTTLIVMTALTGIAVGPSRGIWRIREGVIFEAELAGRSEQN